MYSSSLALVSEGLSIDQTTSAATAYSIVESIGAPSFPTFVHVLFFVAWIDRNADDPVTPPSALTISLDGEAIMVAAVNVDFGSDLRARVGVRINGLLVPKPGKLRFVMSVGSTSAVAERSLAVAATGPAATPIQPSLPLGKLAPR